MTQDIDACLDRHRTKIQIITIFTGVYLVGVRKALEGMLHNLEIALAHIHQTNPTYANKNNDEILQGKV